LRNSIKYINQLVLKQHITVKESRSFYPYSKVGRFIISFYKQDDRRNTLNLLLLI